MRVFFVYWVGRVGFRGKYRGGDKGASVVLKSEDFLGWLGECI